MITFSKSSLRHETDHFIVHVGINDLKSEKTPECIAE